MMLMIPLLFHFLVLADLETFSVGTVHPPCSNLLIAVMNIPDAISKIKNAFCIWCYHDGTSALHFNSWLWLAQNLVTNIMYAALYITCVLTFYWYVRNLSNTIFESNKTFCSWSYILAIKYMTPFAMNPNSISSFTQVSITNICNALH